MKITANLLRAHDACEAQVEIFKAEWPDGTRVTLKACRRATELHLHLAWAALKLFSQPGRTLFSRTMTPLWDAYRAKLDSLGSEEREAWAATWAAYYKLKARAFYEAAKLGAANAPE